MNAVKEVCADCQTKIDLGIGGMCDGSGVIAKTEIPESSVYVCPAWPCDKDEPLAFWEAQVGLGYDVPASLQERILSNTMAAVQQIKQATPTEQQVEVALTSSQKMRRLLLVCAVVCIPFWVGVVALVNWATR